MDISCILLEEEIPMPAYKYIHYFPVYMYIVPVYMYIVPVYMYIVPVYMYIVPVYMYIVPSVHTYCTRVGYSVLHPTYHQQFISSTQVCFEGFTARVIHYKTQSLSWRISGCIWCTQLSWSGIALL